MANITEMSEKEMKEKLAKLAELEEKERVAKEKRKEYQLKTADKRAEYNERRRVRQMLILKKAAAQGIKVTEAEVDAELKKLNK